MFWCFRASGSRLGFEFASVESCLSLARGSWRYFHNSGTKPRIFSECRQRRTSLGDPCSRRSGAPLNAWRRKRAFGVARGIVVDS